MTLLFKIQKYLHRTGMPETKFGRLAVNDPRLVGDLRRGRCPGARMCARVERFMMTGQKRPFGAPADAPVKSPIAPPTHSASSARELGR